MNFKFVTDIIRNDLGGLPWQSSCLIPESCCAKRDLSSSPFQKISVTNLEFLAISKSEFFFGTPYIQKITFWHQFPCFGSNIFGMIKATIINATHFQWIVCFIHNYESPFSLFYQNKVLLCIKSSYTSYSLISAGCDYLPKWPQITKMAVFLGCSLKKPARFFQDLIQYP